MDHDQIPLAFRPYITAIEEHCRSLSKEELVETILSLAGSVPPRERASFLDRISEGSGRGVRGLDADDLITRIEGIREEIEARISAIEDGSYWDEYQDEFDDRYDWDDEPASITEEHTSVLGSLLDEAGALFLDGDLVHAAAAYRLLLATFDEYDPYEASFELREHRARYARIVYLLTAADERLERMIEAMRSEADPLFFTESDDEELVDLDDAMPMFADVLDAAPDALPELNHFLRSWIERFDASESARAQSLYLEAVYLTDGLDGLEATARRWGKDRPRAYLAWIERLAKHGAWERVALASREALGTISVGEPRVASFRYRAGEYLEKAGERLADRSLRNEGASEMFSVRPTEDTLAKLLLVSPERRDESLAQAACLLSGRSQRRYLYVEVLLMAGRVEETLEIARTCEPVGWSSYDNPGGVCFASFLAMPVVEDLRAYPTIHSLLERYAGTSAYEHSEGETDHDANRRLVLDEILRGIASVNVSAQLRSGLRQWAHDIGTRRIDTVVSNKHRNAYERAALVLVALYESHVYEGEPEFGRGLIERYRSRYNRHTAFKRELDAVLSRAR